MFRLTGRLRRSASRLVAITLVLSLFGFARLPDSPLDERAALAARFSFVRLPLTGVPGVLPRSVREVNPSLEHISAWISSVGASVALHDLDGDGLPNDVCHVDARTDQVIVEPVPGTPPRYKPFVLDVSPLPYDFGTMAPMGCLPGDVNEDGHTDLIVYFWGRTPVAFLGRPAPISAVSYVRSEVYPGGERWYTNAATLSDLDGDGHVDLLVGNYFQDGARILDAASTSREQMGYSMSRAYNGGRNRLLLWAGATAGASPTVDFRDAAGVFEDQVARGWTLAVGTADLDGDLLPEVYFANDFGPDRLLHNRSKAGQPRFALLQGRETVTTPSSKVLGKDSFKGMGVDFGDLNGDGLLDIYVSNIAAEYALEESHFAYISTGKLDHMRAGIAPYVDRSEPLGLSRSGWAWDARLDDFDNDGVPEALQATGFVKGTVNRWPELHELAMGNDELLQHPGSWPRFQPGDDLSGHQRNPFFVRNPDGRYVDIAAELGLGERDPSRGIATADVDGDGDLDFAVANQWGASSFYRNESPHPGGLLGIRLMRALPSETRVTTIYRAGQLGSNLSGQPAIGASATVYLPDGRRLTAQVDGGNGHSGKRSPDLHFGLGHLSPNTRLKVEVRWRDADGSKRQETLQMEPGWHTVLLSKPGNKEE